MDNIFVVTRIKGFGKQQLKAMGTKEQLAALFSQGIQVATHKGDSEIFLSFEPDMKYYAYMSDIEKIAKILLQQNELEAVN